MPTTANGASRWKPNRRTALALGLAGLGGAALGWPWRGFGATAPHRFRHGAFEITVVSDGHLVLPAAIMAPDAPKAELDALLATLGQGPEQVMPATNITLIETSSELILVDTGSGASFQPTAGKLMENLSAAGVDPARVTTVVFTHAHPDHLWGTIGENDVLRFPRASYAIAAAEWDFWMAPDRAATMPEALRPYVLGAQRHLGGVKERVRMARPGDEIVPGVRVIDTPGHTPGHLSLELAGGDGLIVVGDALPSSAVSFAHPEWRFGFDTISDVAIESRRRLLDRAAAEKTTLIGYHWPYPGVGHAERRDGAYRFVPA